MRPLMFTDLSPLARRRRTLSRCAWALVIGAVGGAVTLAITIGVLVWL